jgi:hypothetical protein
MKKRPIDQIDLFGGRELPMEYKPNEKQKFLQELFRESSGNSSTWVGLMIVIATS